MIHILDGLSFLCIWLMCVFICLEIIFRNTYYEGRCLKLAIIATILLTVIEIILAQAKV